VAPELLAREGPAGARVLDPRAQADAELGFAVRAVLGPLDAGQAVVVADGSVLAIEGAEGTDAMLARVESFNRSLGQTARSGVLAKGPKPGQELRVDMPTVGPRTVERAAAARLAGVAVEAGGVLLLDRDKAVQAADDSGLAIEGLPNAQPPRIDAASRQPSTNRMVGAKRPDSRAEADMPTCKRRSPPSGAWHRSRPVRQSWCRAPTSWRWPPRNPPSPCWSGCARCGSGASEPSAGSA
jgi:hypothetical protein